MATSNVAFTHLAALIKKRRQSIGRSQTEVGHSIGRDQAYISKLETGQANPSIDTLVNLATALDAEIVLVPKEHLAAYRSAIRSGSQPQRVSSVFEDVFVPDPTEADNA